MQQGGVVVLDFGSQYTQLIARRIREQHVFSIILSHDASLEEVQIYAPRALILSGGPSSVMETSAPAFDLRLLDLELPILGICYGLQLLAHHYGGQVEATGHGEYGYAQLALVNEDPLFHSVSNGTQVWMSHMDRVVQVPEGWQVSAYSSNEVVAAMSLPESRRYATQFHPEVSHTVEGGTILRNFLFRIAGCEPTWTPGSFVQDQIRRIRERVGTERVLIGISGGVDSSVVAALMHRAIGDQVVAVLIDHGLLRKNEALQCLSTLRDGLGVNVQCHDEGEIFLQQLAGVVDPEQKRKIIGEQFIRSFERIAAEMGEIRFLAQGTLYPDVIESGTRQRGGPAAVIKSHHNVGGLPDNMQFELIEPLRDLFKDEVRNVGRELGLPETLIHRHPFPGPGLAVRIIGEVTPERLEILREADEIFLTILREENLYDEIWQAFTVLIPVKTVGVMGDQRTYENLVALRAVTSSDGMTADWFPFSPDVLSKIANRIVNSVKGVNRVVYDVTSKPPGTIEWE
jgi:GMP synthase (glutamine-hydrolysing)